MFILKFGGASVSGPKAFHSVAKLIAQKVSMGREVVVVISAMANVTDQLQALARQVHPNPPRRELDMMLSAGERVSTALLAMALNQEGVEAVSFTGSQSGIITSEDHANARILEVKPHRVLEALNEGKVVIVAGFQGVSRSKEITTIGRGGSDITAIALAAALGAPMVEFYKDVPGIFHVDPKSQKKPIPLKALSYEEALLLSKEGDKVLHSRCIELAEKNGIQLLVRSFLDKTAQGSWIGRETQRKTNVYYEEAHDCRAARV